MHRLLLILPWIVPFAWMTRAIAAQRGLPTVPDLLRPEHDGLPAGDPTLTVIVPARDEGANIRDCLESLLAQDYPHVNTIAVDDRSSDQTGALMDALAAAHPMKLRVVHIAQLPAGWLGKTHAMAFAATQAIAQDNPDFLLFTDADILFAPSALRRALANAVATRADHLVVAPTPIIRRWDEGVLLAFFQILGLWAVRPWRVANPKALRDAIGIGAFNMVRTSAYLKLGGFEALRMEVVEDLGLARRVKLAGLRQRIAFGRGLVRVHWAAGALGIVNVMTKNIFSAMRFNPLLLMGSAFWLVLFFIGPFVGVWFSPHLPGAVSIAMMVWVYRLMSRASGLSAWNVLLAPLAAVAFVYALMRSMFVTLRQGGVMWRGTFYPLAELRRSMPPLIPRRSRVA